MRQFILLVAIAVAGSVVLARPGLVITQSGQQFEGDVTEKGESVIVSTRGGATTIPRDQIVAIEYQKEFPQEFADRLARLDAKDIAGRVDLARWAMRQEQYLAARDALESALAVNPNSAEAVELQRFVRGQLRLAAKSKLNKPIAEPPVASGESGASGQSSFRVLDADDVQAIRRAEWQHGDESTRVRIDAKAGRQYAESRRIRWEEFIHQKPIGQARTILEDPYATDEQRSAVTILSDPPALAEFRRAVQPLILNGCAASGCHGGVNAAKFRLVNPVSNDEAAYTNFYVLSGYTTMISSANPARMVFGGEKEMHMIDRGNPQRSLLIQYALPLDVAEVAHPIVRNFTPLFRSMSEPKAQPVVNWIEKMLRINPGDYRIDAAPRSAEAPPATQPD